MYHDRENIEKKKKKTKTKQTSDWTFWLHLYRETEVNGLVFPGP